MKHLHTLFLAVFLVATSVATAQTVSGTSSSRRIRLMPPIPAPTAPAQLLIENIKLLDFTSNGMIDAGKNFSIRFTISNITGRRPPYAPQVGQVLFGLSFNF